jgi:probable phosphoglycerate mutase
MRMMLVRHGATPNNVEARFTGQTDVPMSPLGERQAEAVARRLAASSFDLIVSSDLSRAQGTASRIAAGRACELRLDPELREVSLGAWEGLRVTEVEARSRDELRAWRSEAADFAPPEGESLAGFSRRVARALRRWADPRWGDRVLLVTHGGVIGIALCLALGIPLAHHRQFVRDNTSLTELDFPATQDTARHDGDSLPRAMLVRLNDTAHLEGVVEEGEGERAQVI